MKIKRYIATPLVLLVYLVVMAVYALPNYQESGDWLEFSLVVGGTLAILVALFFMLKRRETFRDERKKQNNKEENN